MFLAGSLLLSAGIKAQSSPENRTLFHLHWTKAETLGDQLPFSLHVYLTEDSLHGRPFRAAYIQADPMDLKLDYTISLGAGLTPQAFYDKDSSQPYVLINGSWDDPDTHQSQELAIRGGKLLAYNQTAIHIPSDSTGIYRYVTPSAIGVTGGRLLDVGWVFTDSSRDYPLLMLKGPSNPKHSYGKKTNPSILDIHPLNTNGELGAKTMDWHMEVALGGGPTLVKRGQVYVSSHEELRLNGQETQLTARTAMGCTRDNKLIILVIEDGHPESSGATLLEAALILKDLGCWEALNMSGGPSTVLLINGKPLIRPADRAGSPPLLGSVFMIKSQQ